MNHDYTTGHSAAQAAWRLALGADRVFDAQHAQVRWGADTTGITRRIGGGVQPQTEKEVAEVVRIANQFGVHLHPVSTGRNWGYGTALPPMDGSVIVDLGLMQRIVDFDPELGVVTVEPGVTQGMLHHYLTAGGHPFMVPTTGAGPDCSLMGNALQRGYGITPISDHFAAVTDLRAILWDGSLFRSSLAEKGGDPLARLYKWGIGPYELGRFSQGEAGIVTQISIVLARRPEAVQMALFSLKDDALLEEAVIRVRHLLGSLPGLIGGINLMNQHRVLAMTAPYPHDAVDDRGVLPADVIQQMGRERGIAAWTGVVTMYGPHRLMGSARREIRSRLKGVASRLVFVSPELIGRVQRVASALPPSWLGGRVGKLASSVKALQGALELAQGIPNRTALPLAYWRHRSRSPGDPIPANPNPARDGCGLIWYSPLVPMRPDVVRRQVTMVESVLPAHGLEPLITLTSLNDRLFDSTVPLLFDPIAESERFKAHLAFRLLVAEGAKIGTYPYRIPRSLA